MTIRSVDEQKNNSNFDLLGLLRSCSKWLLTVVETQCHCDWQTSLLQMDRAI